MQRKRRESSHCLRIALAGFGTVGRAVAAFLEEEKAHFPERLGVALQLGLVLDRSYRDKIHEGTPGNVRFTESLEEFLENDCEIWVELLGGLHPADRIIEEGLRSRRAVITANKSLLARQGRHYFELSLNRKAFLGFEASVGGGIPILRTLRHSLLVDQIQAIRGVLNGTCNFVLSQMARHGAGFEAALQTARKMGYAEADPRLDVNGSDTAEKLSILAALAFGHWTDPAAIPTHGIDGIISADLGAAQSCGCLVRLLGMASQGPNLRLYVGPCWLPEEDPLAGVDGVLNAIEVSGKRLGSSLFVGQGAGGEATAVSVMSDIVAAARALLQGRSSDSLPKVACTPVSSPREEAGSRLEPSVVERRYPFYLRVSFPGRERAKTRSAIGRAFKGVEVDYHSLDRPAQSRGIFMLRSSPMPFQQAESVLSEVCHGAAPGTRGILMPVLDDWTRPEIEATGSGGPRGDERF